MNCSMGTSFSIPYLALSTSPHGVLLDGVVHALVVVPTNNTHSDLPVIHLLSCTYI